MKPRYLFTLCILLLLSVLLVGTLCACSPSDKLSMQGIAHRGAVLRITNRIGGEDVTKKSTYILRNGVQNAHIRGNELVINEDAPIGSVITVEATYQGSISQITVQVQPSRVESIALNPVSSCEAGDNIALSSVVYPSYATDRAVVYSLLDGADVASIIGNVLCIDPHADQNSHIVVVAEADSVRSEPMVVPIDTIHADSVVLEGASTLLPGGFAMLSVKVFPADCTEVISLSAEGEYASKYVSIEGLRIAIAPGAPEGEFDVVARVGHTASAPFRIRVSGIRVSSISIARIQSSKSTVSVGDEIVLQSVVSPSNATYRQVSYTVTEGAALVEELAFGRYRVIGGTAGSFITIVATADGVEDSLSLAIVDNALSALEIVASSVRLEVGDECQLTAYTTPASFASDVTYQVLSGSEYVALNGDRLTIIGYTDSPIVVEGALGDLRQQLSLHVQPTPVTQILLTAEREELRAGESSALTVSYLPLTATHPHSTLRIVSGAELGTIEGNLFTANDSISQDGEVVIVAEKEGISSNFVTILVQAGSTSDIDSIIISANREELLTGEEAQLSASVYPDSEALVTYRIIQGAEWGHIEDDVFYAHTNAPQCEVQIVAEAGGVASNPLSIYLLGETSPITPTSWSAMDNLSGYFAGQSHVVLDLSALPKEAGDTVIIVHDDVEQLHIDADGTDVPIRNLYFYFLTTDSIDVTLHNVGIAITNGFTDPVFDFGTQATITLSFAGENLIRGGDAHRLDTNGFTLNGKFDEAAMRRDGSNGLNGMDGGHALHAKSITLAGSGSLSLIGGNASAGTPGMRGGDSTVRGQSGGKGGEGGRGGDGGLAIWAQSITYDFVGTLSLTGGNGGYGGMGGEGGLGLDAPSGSNGKAGNAGKTAVVRGAVYTVQGTPLLERGKTKSGALMRSYDTLDAGIALLEQHYKITIHYKSINNPYSMQYRMTKQTDTAELLRLLRGVEFAVASLGRNTLYDTSRYGGQKLVIYLADKISGGTIASPTTIYGLTSQDNRMWLACFDTRPRDSFYSNYYNIVLHEFLHVLTFNSGISESEWTSELGKFNRNKYFSTFVKNSNGVYDPYGGAYLGASCDYLTYYSKNNYNEDISDNMSLLSMLPSARDFTASDVSFAKKAKYIAEVYADTYHSVDAERLPWSKVIGLS